MAEVNRVLARGRGELDAQRLAALYDRVLRTPTHEGLTLEPLYTAADAPAPGAEGMPGRMPFVRGAHADRADGGWDVRQAVVVHGDGAGAVGAALQELEGGADSVELDLRDARRIDADLLGRVLEGVVLDAAAIGLQAGERGAQAAHALGELCAQQGIDPTRFRGSLGLDPLGDHAGAGGAGAALTDALAETTALSVRVAERNPGVRTIAVDGVRYHAAGASHVQEMGIALAGGVAYLRALEAAGLGLAAAAGQVEFRLAAGADQFLTIAALRAFRRLWGRVGEACGLPPAARGAHIHAIGSPAMETRYDPWVNLLRGTVACFAAGVAGADVVSVTPYDRAREGAAGGLGLRLARNTQRLLIDESGIGRVIDPAGGSFYVEALTDSMAHAAWEWFRRIEAAGGLAAALASGLVQDHIEATARERRDAIAHRRDPITGVSEFPDAHEPPPPAPASHRPPPDTPFRPIVAHRWSEPFEHQRARADRAAAAGGRPAVFLANLGTVADHTARATFAANLFAAAGIEVRQGSDADDDARVAEAFAASDARLACICSSDDVYAERAAAVARSLARAGAVRIYLAGRPGDGEAALRQAGVHEFAYVGCDALALLTGALDVLGVPA